MPGAGSVLPGTRAVVELPGFIETVDAGPRWIYAVYRQASRTERVARIDPRTGVVRSSVPFEGGTDLVLVGSRVWVSGAAPFGSFAGATTVYGFDARTLVLRQEVHMRWRPVALAAGPSGLWAGAGDRLYLLDPSDGRIVSSSRVRGVVVDLAVDPTSRRLYVATRRAHSGEGLPITERDASSGRLLAASLEPLPFAASALAPTPAGVWVSAPTGNFGAVLLLRGTDLRAAGPSIEAQQSVAATISGGALWVADDLNGRLHCADPMTGRIRDSLRIPEQLTGGYSMSNVVALGSSILAGSGERILELERRARCR
jgi:hypothetical protein